MYDVTTSAKKNIMKQIGDDRFPSEIGYSMLRKNGWDETWSYPSLTDLVIQSGHFMLQMETVIAVDCGDQLTYNNHLYKGISTDTMDIQCPLNQSLFAVITQIFIDFMLICIISLDWVLARFFSKAFDEIS